MALAIFRQKFNIWICTWRCRLGKKKNLKNDLEKLIKDVYKYMKK